MNALSASSRSIVRGKQYRNSVSNVDISSLARVRLIDSGASCVQLSNSDDSLTGKFQKNEALVVKQRHLFARAGFVIAVSLLAVLASGQTATSPQPAVNGP